MRLRHRPSHFIISHHTGGNRGTDREEEREEGGGLPCPQRKEEKKRDKVTGPLPLDERGNLAADHSKRNVVVVVGGEVAAGE